MLTMRFANYLIRDYSMNSNVVKREIVRELKSERSQLICERCSFVWAIYHLFRELIGSRIFANIGLRIIMKLLRNN
jgi:hypothetical protein